ncbi:MAG: DegT/DnrJ/EryC1/StrS family aminotransferase [Thaumarchaeota archaeon]|nr:DegT/DnrJ/EryC1/StrS family aminotransferase [Nitrososphaerota archaeon]MCL5317486.1 DegT/DnrJ/EryC1/StrS family aminotransferase [Nitrososphaerota archaeon]
MQLDNLHIPFAMPYFDKEMEEAAIYSLRNEKYVLGESVFRLEEEFARYCGTEHAVSTSSGTNALQIALIAMEMRRNFGVLTPAMSFVASANCTIQAGGDPVFVDINPDRYTIDASAIESALTKNCAAILPVHLYGQPADMNEIMDIAARRNLKVVEDAAQAHGATYRTLKVGAIGDAGCFSFYPTKNMTVCGDGGMITTNDPKIAKISAKLRDCGRADRYTHDRIGYTSRLNTVNAAIGRVQLRHLDEWDRKRQKVAEKYYSRLKDVEEVKIPPHTNEDSTPVYHLYVIQTKRRDSLKEWLEASGVQCAVHYPTAIPLQPAYQGRYGFASGSFPVAEKLAENALSLPMFPSLQDNQIAYICEKIVEFYDQQQISSS